VEREPAPEPTASAVPEAADEGGPRLRDVPWTAGEAVAVFIVAVGIGAVVASAVQALDTPLVRGLSFPLMLISIGATAAVFVRLRYPEHARSLLGGVPLRAAHLGWGVAYGLAGFLLCNVGIAALFEAITRALGTDLPVVQEGLREATQDPELGLLVILSAVVVAPIAEEVYFRGMLFQAIRTRLGSWPGIGIAGLLFGAAHLSGATDLSGVLYTMLVLGTFGMLLAWGMQRRGHLVVPLVMHLVFNGTTMLVILATG
jgi:uncharacterized protein